MTAATRTLLALMIREEWRLHSRLFGGARFALFPAFVAAVAAGTATFLVAADANADLLVAGLHLVVAVLGLHVGTIGLVGRDALEDLLGETTLVLFSARTLPVEPAKLLVVFLCKDVGYYAVLFLVPLTMGLVPLVAAGHLEATRLLLVFATTLGVFAVGVGASVTLVGVHTRSPSAAVAFAAVAVAAIVVDGARVLALTPYGLLTEPRPVTVVASVLLPLGLGAIGVALFEFDRRPSARTTADRFTALRRTLGPIEEGGLVAKSVLEVARSSGGLWKVPFSQGLVFGVLVLLLAFLPDAVGVEPSPGLTIASVLALGSFTTYNWLCQFDDTAFYGRYPVSLASVVRAKLLAFSLLALPTGFGFLAVGVFVFGTGTTLVGVAVFAPLCLYVFGVTAVVAGLEPTELLFDTPVFAAFTAATMIVLVPLVVAAIAAPLAPQAIAIGSVVYAWLAGGVGLLLARRAGPRWQRLTLEGRSR